MPGLQVRDAGADVGHVVSAQPTRRGTARVVVEIDDPAIWPLPAGTQAQYRWAGTIAFTNRYVQLTAPKSDGRWLHDGSVIGGRDVTQSVEFDQLFDVFDGTTRARLKTLIDEGGPALADARPGLIGALHSAPSALAQARLALQELGSDPAELNTLVNSTDAVVGAVQSSNPGVDTLVSGAATTLAATAQEATALGQSLHELPATLTDAQNTLQQADPTLTSADAVLQRVSPGVHAVIGLAPALDTALRTVVQVGPSAEQTLAHLHAAVPELNPLLTKAQSLMPEIQTIGQLGAKELNCIRPYAPEAAGLASTWDGFIQYSDGHDKYARVSGGIYPYPSSEMPTTSADIVKLFPALHYVFPAPPGEVVGQPWFNSACGVGPDSLNAADDPEDRK
jgi:phospholipid/cholesterol/gamma-HCH transport system substrate-binding protein